jgi:hypothetical protein
MATKIHTQTVSQLNTALCGPGGLLVDCIITLQGHGDTQLNALVNDLVALRRELAGAADKHTVTALVKRIYNRAGQVNGHNADVQRATQQLRDTIMNVVRA